MAAASPRLHLLMWSSVVRGLPAQTLARVLEALLPFMLAAWFGAGQSTDLYYGAQAASMLVVSLAASAFQDSAAVPRLARMREQEGRDAEASLFASLTHIALRSGVLIGALFLVFGGLYLHLAFGATMAGVGLYVLPYALSAPIMSLRSLWVASAQSRGALTVAPLATACSLSLGVALAFALRSRGGIGGVPTALLAGECGAALVAGLFARQAGLSLWSFGPVAHKEARATVRLVASEVFGGALTRMNPVIDQTCVRILGVAGAVTHVKYATDIAGVPTSIVGSMILPAVFLSLATDFGKGDVQNVRRTTRQAAWQLSAMLVLSCVVLAALRLPLVSVLFGHGKMQPSDVSAMAELLPWALINSLPFGVMLLYVRANVAMGNSGIMWRAGFLNVVFNALFDVSFGMLWGVKGVLLGTAATHACIAFFLYQHYRRVTAEHLASIRS